MWVEDENNLMYFVPAGTNPRISINFLPI